MSERKKRILLISCFFYPQNRIPVLRIGQWAKYWASEGHDVTVLTTKKYAFMGPFGLDPSLPEEVRVVEVPCLPQFLERSAMPAIGHGKKQTAGKSISTESSIKKKVRSLRGYIGSNVDIHDFWVGPAYRAGMHLLAENRYDAIVSSYSPPAAHLVASKLKKKHPDLIWFADFRDLWANNHITSAKGVFKWMESARENRCLRGRANAIITVSRPLAIDLQARHPELPVWVIENGFDPQEFPRWMQVVSAGPQLTGNITICYAGTIYPNRRDPTPLFNAVNELIDSGELSPEKIKIEFYGQNEQELSEIIQRTRANRHNIIKIKGFVTRQVSLEAQRRSDLLLLLESGEPLAKGMLTGKVFEYLVSGIPILAVGIDNTHAAGELLENTGTGYCSSDTDELKRLLLAAIELKHFSFYRPRKDLIARFSRQIQARSIIDRLAAFQGAASC
ncbi:glycosyltransferase [Pollutimonas subterranea]|nr:glycosyltransferase [Pollutimonas subterranea]